MLRLSEDDDFLRKMGIRPDGELPKLLRKNTKNFNFLRFTPDPARNGSWLAGNEFTEQFMADYDIARIYPFPEFQKYLSGTTQDKPLGASMYHDPAMAFCTSDDPDDEMDTVALHVNYLIMTDKKSGKLLAPYMAAATIPHGVLNDLVMRENKRLVFLEDPDLRSAPTSEKSLGEEIRLRRQIARSELREEILACAVPLAASLLAIAGMYMTKEDKKEPPPGIEQTEQGPFLANAVRPTDAGNRIIFRSSAPGEPLISIRLPHRA